LSGGCGSVPTSLTIEEFSVTVGCSATAVDEAPDTYTIYTLTAAAQRGRFSDSTFISRRVRATVTE
jgi:hypothetical protein